MPVGSPPSSRAVRAGSLYDRGMDDSGDLRSSSSRRRLVVIAVVVVVLLLVGVALFLGLGSGSTSGQSAPPSAATPARSSTTAPTATTSSPAAGSDAVPTATPQDVTWSLFQGVALPSSPSAGPSRVDGPVYAGYAHTPEGALVAATQVSSRVLVTPAGGWRQVLDEQVVAGQGRDAYANLRGQVGDAAPSGGYAQYAGFQFVTYSSDIAVISLANKSPNGTYQVTNFTVRWTEGDWKLEIPPTGQSQTQAVQGLVGYVPWSGVS